MWRGRPRTSSRRSLFTALAVAGTVLLYAATANAQAKPETWSLLEEKAHWVATGAEDPERIIYVFSDPNCPYCHDLWKATRPYYQEGLQVRHILVGILRPSSPGKAAAILGADDPARTLNEHERNYEDGGIEPADNPDPEARSQLETNRQLMQELGARATPTLFYRDGDGSVQRIAGMPPLEALPDILRLPEQPIEDPDLQQYL
ncbi:Thioredoxin-like domain-containing protein [Thiohalospira halophila DSM 15071]|uniref:Thiol:disulfide interchange protein n=1 Tax=Thiohalospira halophila DSM 15071 TaxID=1123397 RepID=A0A1I1N5A5_9GAMM|nr:thiol:disulfide interchange protein DsbG [Thiohalospira halophila]SFC92857.1 Thioredoxin-like domain-containing protein [Thiohalospira halophila DSM 15071]